MKAKTSELAKLQDLLSGTFEKVTGSLAQQNSNSEKTLRAIIDYYENIIDCMPGNVHWYNKEGIAVACNKNVLDMLGMKAVSEFRGLTFEAMGKIGNWTKETTEKFKNDTLYVIETGRAKLQEEEPPIPGKSGETIYFLTSRVPLFDKDRNVIGAVCISTEITKLKLMEESLRQAKEKAEAADAVKAEFLKNMRHDIRTPLSGIIGFAQLIQAKAQNFELQSYAADLIVSSEALLHYLNEILESIRMNSENTIEKKKFSLKKILQSIVELMLAKTRSKGLELNFSWDEKIPEFVIGDPKRIHRVVLELVSNAINFTEKGFIRLSAHIKGLNDNRFILQLIVEDSGIGIVQTQQSEIFTRFKKGFPSYQGVYKGLGLGLSIVKEFLDDLEGEIYLESERSVGTKFTCLIPMRTALLQDAEGCITSLPQKKD